MPVIAKGGVDTLVSAPPAVYLRAVYLREMNVTGEKRLISALSSIELGALFSSLITKESVH